MTTLTTLRPLTLDQAAAELRPALEGIQRKSGRLPNIIGVLAHTPVALNAYLQLSGAVGKCRLSARQRELIALAVGARNQCDYCVAAHTAIGAGVGIDAQEARAARTATAADPRDAVLLQTALAILEGQGHLPPDQRAAFLAAGFEESVLLEVMVVVVLNVLTNWTNHLAETEIDFPVPEAA